MQHYSHALQPAITALHADDLLHYLIDQVHLLYAGDPLCRYLRDVVIRAREPAVDGADGLRVVAQVDRADRAGAEVVCGEKTPTATLPACLPRSLC